MNIRNTAIWLVVFAALGIFAWTLRDSEPKQVGPDAPTPEAGALFDFDVSAVTAVSVSGNGLSYELTRDDADDWLVDGRPASDSVNSTIAGAVDPSVLRVLPADRDPDDYGFASPWLTVTFTVSDTERVLFVGDAVPTSSSDRYVREGADGAMHTVSAFDLERMQEWLSAPPDAPTATPEPSATPEESEDVDADADADADADGEGADGDGADVGDADEAGEEDADADDDAAEEDPDADENEDATVPGDADAEPDATGTVAPTATPTATPDSGDGDDG